LTKKPEVSGARAGVAKGKYGICEANVVSALANMEFITTNLSRVVKKRALNFGGKS
jgi:hypothetical protein